MPYPEPDFNVEELFAIGGVSLLTGASGVGKSHMAFQIGDDVIEGNPIFGFKCVKKIKPIYFTFDRPITGVYHTLNKMGLDFTDRMQLISLALSDCPNIPSAKEVGDANFIILDGLDLLFPPGKLIDLGVGIAILRRCQKLAAETKSTILGVTGHSKQKGDNSGYVLSREKSIGTTAFGRASESMIVMDFDLGDLTGTSRIVTVNVRDARSKSLRYEFNEDSWLIEMPSIEAPLSDLALQFWTALPFNTIITRDLLYSVGLSLPKPIKKSKVYECLAELIKHKRIVESAHHKYRKIETKAEVGS